MSADNPLDDIAANVAGLDLWQPRDWPHRRGDEIRFDLLAFPLPEDSPGRRSHCCENCGQSCLCIHDNVICWKCKAAFCLLCTVADGDPTRLALTPPDEIVENGFAKCHSCEEPLRSVGLVDVFRSAIETNTSTMADMSSLFAGKSLVQEAEDALKRGQDCAKRDPERAILEYTHAINAINYLASLTAGTRFVLRAKDILLIAHSLRAQLEDNQALYDAVLAAYPKASVRSATGTEQVWYISREAFTTLFYPLQANLMCGSKSQGGLVVTDQRAQCLSGALSSPEFRQQVALAKYSLSFFSMFQNASPHCEGIDARFESLKGIWRGLQTFASQPLPDGDIRPCVIGNQSVVIMTIVQFIRVFPTNLAALEDVRIQIETKSIGEETSLKAKEAPHLAKLVRKNAKQFGVQDLHKVHVIKGSAAPAISVVAAVGNAATKLFCLIQGEKAEEASCYLAGKALAYLERQLKECRTTSPSSTPETPPYYHSDITVCAYCGSDNTNALKSCCRCKLARYCTVECQKKHYSMKGPFGHKLFCKSVVVDAANTGSG